MMAHSSLLAVVPAPVAGGESPPPAPSQGAPPSLKSFVSVLAHLRPEPALLTALPTPAKTESPSAPAELPQAASTLTAVMARRHPHAKVSIALPLTAKTDLAKPAPAKSAAPKLPEKATLPVTQTVLSRTLLPVQPEKAKAEPARPQPVKRQEEESEDSTDLSEENSTPPNEQGPSSAPPPLPEPVLVAVIPQKLPPLPVIPKMAASGQGEEREVEKVSKPEAVLLPSPIKANFNSRQPNSKTLVAAQPAPPRETKSEVPEKPPIKSNSSPIPLTPAPIESDAGPAQTALTIAQPAEAQTTAAVLSSMDPPSKTNGTVGALSGQRMKFTSEKNEIAGRTEQKMPGAPGKTIVSTKPSDDMVVTPVLDRPAQKQDAASSIPALASDWPAKAGEFPVEASKTPAVSPAAPHAALQAERLGQMVTQQVVMVRQSGANSLAVSLKLDPQTELSLQLTHHNGQIEASLRWERGGIEGLDSHWKDLQDSLAKQNVQLLPLENKILPKAPVFNSSSDASSESSFNHASTNSRRHNREEQAELAASAFATVPVISKTKSSPGSPQGWETWA